MSHQERLNIAVFIDFDNIEIGVKTTLNEHFDVGIVLDAIKERGEVVTKIAYADWTRAGEYSRHLTQHAIRLVQRNLTPGGDKNGADINLALDALEMVFTHQHINAYVIVGGDSDFLSLVEKLKQYDKKVFVVGGRAFTSVILQRNCHEFIAYENLTRSRRPAAKGDRPVAVTAAAPIAQAFPIVRRALKILSDREVSPQTGLLKSTLLQLDSTFSERNYGASSFLDFAEKLAQAGLVHLKHSGRSVMVELNDGFDDGTAGQAGPSSGTGATTEPDSASPSADGAGVAQGGAGAAQVFRPAGDRPAGDQPSTRTAATSRRPGRGRATGRADSSKRLDRALADVSPQREADSSGHQRRLRRAAVRLRRADGSAPCVSARRTGPRRARSTRRPARVSEPGPAARGSTAGGPGARVARRRRAADRNRAGQQARGRRSGHRAAGFRSGADRHDSGAAGPGGRQATSHTSGGGNAGSAKGSREETGGPAPASEERSRVDGTLLWFAVEEVQPLTHERLLRTGAVAIGPGVRQPQIVLARDRHAA